MSIVIFLSVAANVALYTVLSRETLEKTNAVALVSPRLGSGYSSNHFRSLVRLHSVEWGQSSMPGLFVSLAWDHLTPLCFRLGV
jgi:hypothetical protein